MYVTSVPSWKPWSTHLIPCNRFSDFGNPKNRNPATTSPPSIWKARQCPKTSSISFLLVSCDNKDTLGVPWWLNPNTPSRPLGSPTLERGNAQLHLYQIFFKPCSNKSGQDTLVVALNYNQSCAQFHHNIAERTRSSLF